jgi:hypothetical protein
MGNEGAWCGIPFRQTFQRDTFVPDVRVVRPPVHGEAAAMRMAGRVVRTNGSLPHTIAFAVHGQVVEVVSDRIG